MVCITSYKDQFEQLPKKMTTLGELFPYGIDFY